MHLAEPFRRNEHWTILASHLILVIMMGFFADGLIRLTGFVYAGWHSLGMLALLVAVAIEALVSYRVMLGLSSYDWSTSRFRSAEWILLALLVKLFTELRFGWGNLAANVGQWSHNFLMYFLSAEFLTNLLLCACVWLAVLPFARGLAELEGDLNILRYGGVPIDRRGAHRKVRAQYLWMGLVLVAAAGLLRQDSLPVPGRSPLPAADIQFVFWYFLFGLVLLSLTNFSALRGDWSQEQVALPGGLVGRWLLSSLAFVGVLTGVARLLPTRYSLGFLAAVAALLNALVFLVNLIFALATLIFKLAGDVFNLFFRTPKAQAGTGLSTPVPPPTVALPTLVPAPAWWEAAKSVLFWAVLVTLVVYALILYVRQNRELMRTLGHFRPWGWLRAAWTWLTAGLHRTGVGLRSALAAGVQRLRPARPPMEVASRLRLDRFRALSPRQKVLFYYLALVRRAEASGVPRPPWMTPLDYSARLRQELAEQAANIQAMTEAFLQARYSRQPVPAGISRSIKGAWDGVRAALHRRRREEKPK